MYIPKSFDPVKVKNDLVEWIRNYFEENGPECTAVIGISGGADSTVAAALLTEALGKERVIGVLMPQGVQSDIHDSYKVCDFLGIQHVVANIDYSAIEVSTIIESALMALGKKPTTVTTYNTPARIRMTTLYGIAGSVNGRVVNTCNLSEDWVGYSTKFGDSAGDFSPLMKLTKSEVKAVGDALGLPRELVHKTPTDGLCGKSDEDNLGFTYDTLDQYIRTGIYEDEAIKQKIDTMHKNNLHKIQPMPHFNY